MSGEMEGCFESFEGALKFLREYEERTNSRYVIKKKKKRGMIVMS
jgi:hypothetical protein